MGFSDQAIYAIDEAGHSQSTEGDDAALAFARKLTTHPRLITDRDIARLRKHFSDHEVAEIVHVVCFANSFDRLVESLRLPIDDL